jgi:hypothetical protein
VQAACCNLIFASSRERVDSPSSSSDASVSAECARLFCIASGGIEAGDVMCDFVTFIWVGLINSAISRKRRAKAQQEVSISIFISPECYASLSFLIKDEVLLCAQFMQNYKRTDMLDRIKASIQSVLETELFHRLLVERETPIV